MNSPRNIRTDSDTSGNETFSSFGKCATPSNRMNVRIMKWIEYAETEYATKEIPLSAEKPLNSIHMLTFTLCFYIFSPHSFCFLNCAENGCSSRCCCIPFFFSFCTFLPSFFIRGYFYQGNCDWWNIIYLCVWPNFIYSHYMASHPRGFICDSCVVV